jgi:hypothetical protein
MSRPGFSFIGFVTPFGVFLALVLPAFLPARASAQAVAPLTDNSWTRGDGDFSLADRNRAAPGWPMAAAAYS